MLESQKIYISQTTLNENYDEASQNSEKSSKNWNYWKKKNLKSAIFITTL